MTATQINREEFLRALESVEPGLSKKPITEQSDCLVFQNGRVHAFNDEVYCRAPSPLEGFEGAVPAPKLLDILRKVEQEELEVSNSNGQLIFTGQRGERFKVRIEAEILLPVESIEKPKKADWKPLHPEFGEALTVTGNCASRDQSRFEATCVHICPQWIEAFDDMRMCRWQLETGLKEPVLVRQSSLRQVPSLGMTHWCVTAGWLHFKNATSGLLLSCRRYHEEFPDLEPVLKLIQGEPAQLPKGLGDAIERAAVFSSENPDANLVKVRLTPGKARVSGCGLSGEYSKPLSAKYAGEVAEFLVPPALLQDVIKRHSEVLIGTGKMWVNTGRAVFLTCLVVPEDEQVPASGGEP